MIDTKMIIHLSNECQTCLEANPAWNPMVSVCPEVLLELLDYNPYFGFGYY